MNQHGEGAAFFVPTNKSKLKGFNYMYDLTIVKQGNGEYGAEN